MRSKDVRILGITDIIATGSDIELINDRIWYNSLNKTISIL